MTTSCCVAKAVRPTIRTGTTTSGSTEVNSRSRASGPGERSHGDGCEKPRLWNIVTETWQNYDK